MNFIFCKLKNLKKHKTTRLVNAYGPTEATVFITCIDLNDPNDITIGTSGFADTVCTVVDENLNPLPAGEVININYF